MNSDQRNKIFVVIISTIFLCGLLGFFMGAEFEQRISLALFLAGSPFTPWYFAVSSGELFARSTQEIVTTLLWLSIWPPIALSPLYSYKKNPKNLKLAVFAILWLLIGIFWLMVFEA